MGPACVDETKHQRIKSFCFFFSKKKNLLLSCEKEAKRLLFLVLAPDALS
jgi:hypothetical protein